MASVQLGGRCIPRSTWTTLSCKTLSVLTTVLALAVAASLLSASMGMPDGVVPIALTTVVVIGLGLAFVRLFTYLEANGVPRAE
ncbi:hypothetical protein ACLI4Z_07245 [Natrialbaceae archaeon A-arb3/5]